MKFFATTARSIVWAAGHSCGFSITIFMADFPDFGSAISELHVDIHYGALDRRGRLRDQTLAY